MPGFAWATALGKVADEFPNTKFGIIDMVVDKPNVQSMVFKAEEGSFLVGVIADETSKTGKVGFVGGMDIPLISAFECGYAQGVKYASGGKSEVIANMTGTTPAAWNDPVKGGELAKSQIDRGADIVFAAAGATGQGVLKAAADAGKFGIGVDSNQNGLFPGHVLTSMLKRVDVATYDSFMDAKNGTWKRGRPGVRPEERRRRLRGRRQQQGHPHPSRQGQGRRRRRPTSSPARSRCTTTCPTTSARCRVGLRLGGYGMAGLDPAIHVFRSTPAQLRRQAARGKHSRAAGMADSSRSSPPLT